MRKWLLHKWLLEDEQVKVRCRPHSRILILPITVGLLIVLAGSAALAKLQPVPFSQWAPGMTGLRELIVVLLYALVIFLELSYPLSRVFRWLWTRYVLTSHRILVREGMLGKITQIHVLDQIEEVRPVQNWRQRLVGSGDLQLHMYRGRMRILVEVPVLTRFNGETQHAWTKVYRASIQRTPR